jgi:hypothetical protein
MCPAICDSAVDFVLSVRKSRDLEAGTGLSELIAVYDLLRSS